MMLSKLVAPSLMRLLMGFAGCAVYTAPQGMIRTASAIACRCSARSHSRRSAARSPHRPALDALSSRDAGGGLRAALSKGIDVAVAQLGTNNGFLNDSKVAIPLPSALEKAERALSRIGMGGQGDELKATMNHAAEKAVAQAKPVFKQALQHMTVSDAKGILTGAIRRTRTSAAPRARS